MKDLKEMTLEELEDFFISLGQPKFRAEQVFRWIYSGVTDFDMMTNLPKTLIDRLSATAKIGEARIYEVFSSSIDGTEKILFQLDDGNLVESVKMVYPYGTSVCVSSQIGCPMGCIFCASTQEGLVRNLTCGEMADQVLKTEEYTGIKVSRVVLMGSGEPLLNYHEVVDFLHLLNNPSAFNISYRRISLSTCGIVPKIKALADEQMPITLAVSLHAPEDSLRSHMMPINKTYPIDQLLDACKYYIIKTKRRITFEYALISGLNDDPGYAHKLAELLGGLLCHINLIPMNTVEGLPYEKSDTKRVKMFCDILTNCGISATVRKEMGSDINAACGQLRRKILMR